MSIEMATRSECKFSVKYQNKRVVKTKELIDYCHFDTFLNIDILPDSLFEANYKMPEIKVSIDPKIAI